MVAEPNGARADEAKKKRRVVLRDPEPLLNSDPSKSFNPRDGDAVVIDIGSSELRAGFSSADGPALRYPPLVSRARDPGEDGRRKNFVGYEALHTSVRSGVRSPFEANIPFNATLLERLLDGTIVALGLANEKKIDRPFVLTEPPCQMNNSRAFIMEVLFEGYQAPSVCLGVDGLFSYMYNMYSSTSTSSLSQFNDRNALIVSSSFRATHVLPLVNGRFHAACAKRINVGGDHATEALARRLRLLYPIFAPALSYDRVNLLREEICYFSSNYEEEVNRLQTDPDYFDQVETAIEIPSQEGTKTCPSPEELERQRKLRAEAGQRLHDMMAARRKAKATTEVAPKEVERKLTSEEVHRVESLLSELDELETISDMKTAYEDDYYMSLSRRGFKQTKDLEDAVGKKEAEIVSLKEELGEELMAQAEEKWRKRKFEDALLETPDPLLTADQLKEKRKVKSIRGAAEARERVKLQKEEERQKVEAAEAELRRQKEQDPDGYLRRRIKERDDLLQRIKKRKAAREAGSDRRSQAARNRMRLIAQQIMPENGKKMPDDFGMRDEDWNVYHDMQGGDTEEEEQEEKYLADLKAEIFELAPHIAALEEAESRGAEKLYYPIERSNELDICLDRIRSTEIIWQPSIVGLDQAGLGESIDLSVSSLQGATARESLVKEIFLTGGLMNTPGANARLQAEVRRVLPASFSPGVDLNIRLAKDPVLDAWRGAALLAKIGGQELSDSSVSRSEYEEMGPEYLKEHFASNVYYQTPQSDRERDNRKRRR
ncbi:hypothetical protein NDN08_006632 [Rhodosorus marinus]|uniref:Actin-related protein 5 n=1 Tax=Rhodosorus marinus TaxID=101924 RepID=A0AAV8UIB9_9RHOD|nr:hypothetical protein NDN08_006632 [Rhodosorus marinus]